MAITADNPVAYFTSKGYHTIVSYDEMILS